MPASLPDTFTYADARAAALPKRTVYSLRDRGLITQIARGVYRRTDAAPSDLGLIAAALKAPDATLCLTSALVRHGLSDAIPEATDVALPRGTRQPAVDAPIRWHSFATDTFGVGRQLTSLDEHTQIGLYSAERSIIDAFRLRSSEGRELGNEALRRWLEHRGSHPGELLALARRFPRASSPLAAALEVLL